MDRMRRAEIPSDTESMDRFIAKAVEQAKRFVLCPERLYEVRLIITEIIANAYLHGNRCVADKRIRIRWAIDEKGFRLRVKDEGEGFDHARLPDPRDPENLGKDHGRGLFLVRLMSNAVIFHGAGNDVEVVKLFPPGPAGTPA